MICKASIISVIYVVNVTQNAELFCPKKTLRLPQMRSFLPSANAEDEIKKNKKKSEARLEPRISILPSPALTTTPPRLL